jgi:hypothetical protein
MLLPQLFCSIGLAANIAGQSFPDQISLGGQDLQVNGVGLRERYWIDIYAAGLYLPEKMNDPKKIITLNAPKKIHSKFIYSNVPKDKMIVALEENISNNPNFSAQTIKDIRQASKWMEDFTSGDEMIFEYIPEKGTTVIIKGTRKGTILGTDFMEAIFSMYVGPHPASEQLREGLLGGK